MSALAVRYGTRAETKKATGTEPTETETLLWENPNYTSNLAAGTKTLNMAVDIDTFSKIRIYYSYSTESTKEYINDTVFINGDTSPSNYDSGDSKMSISLAVRQGTNRTYYSRAVRFVGTTSPYTQMYIGSCSNTSGSTRNQNVIVRRIYGIKTN